MSSDGPKNSQGYIRNLALAGMTGEPYFIQLLDYTDGEWTEQVARAWIWHTSEVFKHHAQALTDCPPMRRERIEHKSVREYMEPIRNAPGCPQPLRAAIDRHLRWREGALRRLISVD